LHALFSVGLCEVVRDCRQFAKRCLWECERRNLDNRLLRLQCRFRSTKTPSVSVSIMTPWPSGRGNHGYRTGTGTHSSHAWGGGGGGDNEHSQGPEFTQTSCQPLFTSYTPYQIVFGWSNQKGEMGGACSMHGELRKLMQKVGQKTCYRGSVWTGLAVTCLPVP
jgi:hypothetical protein